MPTYFENIEDKRRGGGGSAGGKRPLPSPASPEQRAAHRFGMATVMAHEKQNRVDEGKVSRLNPPLGIVHRIDRSIDGFLREEGIEPVSRYQAKFASGRKGLSATLHAMTR